jgi:hypothetical protein
MYEKNAVRQMDKVRILKLSKGGGRPPLIKKQPNTSSLILILTEPIPCHVHNTKSCVQLFN